MLGLSPRQAAPHIARPNEGFAADAKGPINTPTPEGFLYYFLIVCLFSHRYWAVLAKSQAAWASIWPTFVRRIEAQSGSERCISYLITDCHKVHMATAIRDFNDQRGVQSITTAPHSQWQDPAERGIQTITNAARTSLIHGGGKEWMWGFAIHHAVHATNRMPPPNPIPGHEGKSRLCISDPTMTHAKEVRTLKPFLCLAFKTKPKSERGSNFHRRAEPCVHLHYDRTRKSYAMLTLPNLHLTYTLEATFVPQSFPLRVSDYLSNQLYSIQRPSVDDDTYASIHGPANILCRGHLAGPTLDPAALIQTSPTLVRQPVVPNTVPRPRLVQHTRLHPLRCRPGQRRLPHNDTGPGPHFCHVHPRPARRAHASKRPPRSPRA